MASLSLLTLAVAVGVASFRIPLFELFTLFHRSPHLLTVEARKLEHGFRRISARIPYTLP